ncbi:MAG: DUF1553 domain-containing protein [Planctomycetota bacterium]
MSRKAIFLVLLLYCQLAKHGLTQERMPSDSDFFERKIRPILVNKCSECHGSETAESKLRLDTATGLFAGGDSGPVVIPADVESSRLIQLIRGRDDLQMPPDERLEAHEIDALEKWVYDGAVWPGYEGLPTPLQTIKTGGPLFTEEQKKFWSFQPIQKPDVPSLKNAAWPSSPLDHFVLSRLESRGIHPALPADRRTLMRRVTYDLTGLPPTPEEVDAFLADDSTGAFAKVVDRLLASPRYGEQWAQHWLDVVRYAESAGHDGNNAYLHAWRYRDYVIKALNDDKPFDQFVVEQIAGDLLAKTGDPEQDYQQQAAVGFLQVGTKPVVMRDKRQMLLDIADEQLHTIGVAFMGLTLGCARCHDHKFDPIPTADYYSLAGILTSTHVMADKINDSKWVEEEVPGPDGAPVKLMMVRDLPKPENLPIHRRGNYRTLGEEAPRRFLQIIAGEDHPPIETSGSGRLELAHWIADPANPLTARVIVNRLWQHHFGRGLVATSGNFGFRGEKPTHPELLDWLATQLIENEWSLKKMHRLMLLSSTYQQAHVENAEVAMIDPENRLLWRMPRRRLSAEQLRDTMLQVSGELDIEMGGTLFTEGYTANDVKRELYVVDISGGAIYPPFLKPRRSVYLPVIRNGRPEFAALFDSPTAHESTSVRSETTVPTQALMLVNGPFVRQRAETLAEEILSTSEHSTESESTRVCLDRMYKLVLGRPPTAEEATEAIDFLKRYRELSGASLKTTATVQETSILEQTYSELIRAEKRLLNYLRLGSFEFDGADDWFELSAHDSLNKSSDAMTVECWVMPRDVRQHMFIVGRDGVHHRHWKIGVYGQDVNGKHRNVIFSQFFDERLGGQRVMRAPDGVARLNEWTHVAMTYSKGRRRMYVNGKVLDDIEVNEPIPASTQSLTVAARGDQAEWFQGRIDHVAVYSGDLSPVAIREHYRAFRKAIGRGVSSPQLSAWRALCQSLFCVNELIYLE